MSDRTGIEWCDASWNPLRVRNRHNDRIGWHCEHVTPGCENCYAEGFNLRLGTGLPFKPGHRKDIRFVLDDKTLTQPLRWKRPRRVFVCSMTDLFADFVEDAWIDRVFAVMALAPQHQFQVLTKRAERMREYLQAAQGNVWDALTRLPRRSSNRVVIENGVPVVKAVPDWPLPNVWLGVSAERQEEADERIPHLLQTPAAVRFVSAEPLLAPIDLTTLLPDGPVGAFPEAKGRRLFDALCGEHSIYNVVLAGGAHKKPSYSHGWNPQSDGCAKLDWIIVGGESGPKARPMHPQWARDIRDQCQAAGVPLFFKQWGENYPCEFSKRGPNGEVWRTSCGGRDSWFFDEIGASDPPPVRFSRVGKKAAGRLLDGREWNEMPNRAA